MRKSLFFIILCSISLAVLSSCSVIMSQIPGRLYDNSGEVLSTAFQQIIDAIENKDKNALKELFSKEAIKTDTHLDESIEVLFDLVEGSLISYDDLGASTCGETNDENGYRNRFTGTYDIITTGGEYRLSFRMCTVDTGNRDNEGIQSLYIIRAEDTDPQFAYWGDGNWTPGIVIEATP